tara:strand:- start:164 stop:268 length:105 start_codon:yes stop_codon:yes gene_type:complete
MKSTVIDHPPFGSVGNTKPFNKWMKKAAFNLLST